MWWAGDKCLVLLALLLVLPACGPTENEPGADGSARRPQLAVVAMDGLDHRLLFDLLEKGKLPTFQRLLDRGSFAKIDCVVGTTSPVVWTTVATGVAPDDHGITGFEIAGVPVNSTQRRRSAFWNLFTRHGLRVATFGWMVSWPAERDAGLMISDRAHWGEFPAKIWPQDLVDVEVYKQERRVMAPSAVRQFTSYPYRGVDRLQIAKDDPSYPVNFLLTRRLAGIFVRDNSYAEMAREVLSRHEVDVAAIYFQGADYVSHGFWKFFEPEPFRAAGWQVDEDEVRQLRHVIPRYYVHLDQLLAAFLRQLDDDALVLLLSDHGFGPGLGKYAVKSGDYISGNHRFEALAILSGPAVRKAAPQTRTVTHFDVLPTMLAYLGFPIARDLPGTPLLEYFEEDFRDVSSLRYVESYGDEGRAADATRSQHDEEILGELRSLGYIE